MKQIQPYAGSCVILTTKHAKSIAVAPPFWEFLNCSVIEYVIDTDKLGTFSGEVERQGTALECARKKCELILEKFDNVEFALASEGSFGPHPFMPFLPSNHEILYFIDRKRDFHLYLSQLSEKTNYRTQIIGSVEELQKFANDVWFPSHALIMRPNSTTIKEIIFKGLDSQAALEEAFNYCVKNSQDHKVWVQTDMRAQFNPSRMKVISELAVKLAKRLATNCPQCKTPGWGKIREEKGLECSWCGSETEMTKAEIFGCVKCQHQEVNYEGKRLELADPGNCQYCNP